MIEEQDNERATDIFVTTKNKKEFGLNLTTNNTESILLDDKQIPVKISSSAIEILQNFVSNEKSKLVDFANEYQTSGRQFYSFLYDVVALVKYLDDLPDKFLKLTKIKGKADSLMHSRIQAEIAATNYKNGNVDLDGLSNSSLNFGKTRLTGFAFRFLPVSASTSSLETMLIGPSGSNPDCFPLDTSC